MKEDKESNHDLTKGFYYDVFGGWQFAHSIVADNFEDRFDEISTTTLKEIYRRIRESERLRNPFHSEYDYTKLQKDMLLTLRRTKDKMVETREVKFKKACYSLENVKDSLSPEDKLFMSNSEFQYQLIFDPFKTSQISKNIISNDGIRIISKKESREENLNYIMQTLSNNPLTPSTHLTRSQYDFKLSIIDSNGFHIGPGGVHTCINVPQQKSWDTVLSEIKPFLKFVLNELDFNVQGYEFTINYGGPESQVIEKFKQGFVPISDYGMPAGQVIKEHWHDLNETISDLQTCLDDAMFHHPYPIFPALVFEVGGGKMWCIYLSKEEKDHSKKYFIERILTDCAANNLSIEIVIPWDHAIIEVYHKMIGKGILNPVHGIENLDIGYF